MWLLYSTVLTQASLTHSPNLISHCQLSHRQISHGHASHSQLSCMFWSFTRSDLTLSHRLVSNKVWSHTLLSFTQPGLNSHLTMMFHNTIRSHACSYFTHNSHIMSHTIRSHTDLSTLTQSSQMSHFMQPSLTHLSLNTWPDFTYSQIFHIITLLSMMTPLKINRF